MSFGVSHAANYATQLCVCFLNSVLDFIFFDLFNTTNMNINNQKLQTGICIMLIVFRCWKISHLYDCSY